MEYYEKEVKLFEELYNQDRNNTSLKNGLAISYSKMGGIYKTLGKRDKALEYYEKYLKLTEELYNQDRNNASLKNGLAISYERMGGIYETLGESDKALEYYEKVLKLFEELYNQDRNNASLQRGMSVSYYKMFTITLDKSYLKKAIDELKDMKQKGTILPNDEEILTWLEEMFDKMK